MNPFRTKKTACPSFGHAVFLFRRLKNRSFERNLGLSAFDGPLFAADNLLAEASGNAVLSEIHQTLQARIKRIRFVGNETPDRWAGAVAEHEEMIDALSARDAGRLAEVLGRHLDQTLVRVRDAI